MRRTVEDPFSNLPLAERWRLRLRLWWAWRQGLAGRNARIVRQLQERIVGTALIAVRDVSRRRVMLAEFDFAGGTSICVADCHPPTILSLARRIERETVTLEEVAHHGPYWGFYFTTARHVRLPVLAADSYFLQDGGRGGTRRTTGLGTGPSPAPLSI